MTALRWARWFERRCRACLDSRQPLAPYHGRCDLKAGHEGPHALERGLEIVTFDDRARSALAAAPSSPTTESEADDG